jgi:hypothetical protein
MDAVFRKLNYKGQDTVVCINPPESFSESLVSISAAARIERMADGVPEIGFALVFVTMQADIDRLVPLIAPRLAGDAVLWMCYPKGTSKNFKCNFNRDTGWQVMGQHGLEGVRQVAIDEDWSALRFRKVEFIRVMTRKGGALSEAGKAKAGLIS